MIIEGIILASLFLYQVGDISQYAKSVMSMVIRNRQAGITAYDLPQELEEVDGFVASRHCTRIGEIIELKPLVDAEWETFLITDCCGIKDGGCDWMDRNKIWWEVDYETAVRWNTVGRLKRGIGRW